MAGERGIGSNGGSNGGGDQVARALEELEALAREVRSETGSRSISDAQFGLDERPFAAVAGLRALAGDREGGVARLRELVEEQGDTIELLNPEGWTMTGWPTLEEQSLFKVLGCLELCREFAVHGPARLAIPLVEELIEQWEETGAGGPLDDPLVGCVHDTCCRMAADAFRAAGREDRARDMECRVASRHDHEYLLRSFLGTSGDRDTGKESAAARFATEVETFREWIRVRTALRARNLSEAAGEAASLLSCARLAAEVAGDESVIARVRQAEEAGSALAVGVSVPEPLPAPVSPAPPLAREDVEFPPADSSSTEPAEDETVPPPDPEKVRELVEGLGQEKAGIDQLREAARAALALIQAGEDDAARELFAAIRRFVEMASESWDRSRRVLVVAETWVGRKDTRWEPRPGSVAREALELLLALGNANDVLTARVLELLGEDARARHILGELRQWAGLYDEEGEERDDVDQEEVLDRLIWVTKTAVQVGLPEEEIRWYVEEAGRLVSGQLEDPSGYDIDELVSKAQPMMAFLECAAAAGMDDEALEYGSYMPLWREHTDWLDKRIAAWRKLDLETRARLVTNIYISDSVYSIMEESDDPVPPGLYRRLRDEEMASVISSALCQGGPPLATWLLQEYGSTLGYTRDALSLWLDVAEGWLEENEPARAAALVKEVSKRITGYGDEGTAARVLSLCAASGDRERLVEALERAGTMAGDLPSPGEFGRQVVETGLRLAREPEYADRAAGVILDLLAWHDEPAVIAEALLGLAAAFELAGREPGSDVVEQLGKVVAHLEDLSAA